MFRGTEVKEHAANIKDVLIATTAQAATWFDVFERLAASSVSPRNLNSDPNDVARWMATFDCSGYGLENANDIFDIIFEATKENAISAMKDAEAMFEAALIHKSPASTEGFPDGLGADGVQPLFSKSLDDLQFARSIAKHPLVTEDAFNGAKCLAMASCLSDLCAVLQLQMHTDIVRIALAKLALSFASRDDDMFETQVATSTATAKSPSPFPLNRHRR